MNMSLDTNDISGRVDAPKNLDVTYDVGAFQEHAQIVRNVWHEFRLMYKTQQNTFGPLLDSLSIGMYLSIKSLYDMENESKVFSDDLDKDIKDLLLDVSEFPENFNEQFEFEHKKEYAENIYDVFYEVKGSAQLLDTIKTILSLEEQDKQIMLQLAPLILKGVAKQAEFVLDIPRVTI